MARSMTRVSLMGGLGNQLFQLAFALSASKKSELELVPLMKNVRRNKVGNPEISDLSLPSNVKISEYEKFDNSFITSLLGLGLRSSSSGSNPFLVSAIERVVPVLSGEPRSSLRYSRGLGSQIELQENSKSLYVGYFQSHHFASDKGVFGELMNLSPSIESNELQKLIVRAVEEVPYMVHVRLTDYVRENSFGIPSSNYYRESLSSLFELCGKRKIWVFSDDIDLARKYLPIEFSDFYEMAPTLESTVLNWELMRYFSGYVIGNSSFSWWSAFLRRDQDAPVYHPWPWFKSSTLSKSDLIPNNWKTMIQSFEDIV